jgi:hypothetical protein
MKKIEVWSTEGDKNPGLCRQPRSRVLCHHPSQPLPVITEPKCYSSGRGSDIKLLPFPNIPYSTAIASMPIMMADNSSMHQSLSIFVRGLGARFMHSSLRLFSLLGDCASTYHGIILNPQTPCRRVRGDTAGVLRLSVSLRDNLLA